MRGANKMATENNTYSLLDELPNPPRKAHELNLDDLIPYINHPFRVYEGQRFDDLVESIKANNGILTPPLVRPHPTAGHGKYEILSGHNRIRAAKEAGLTKTLCIIMAGITENDAHLCVLESNLIQQSFADWTHSERARILSSHYKAMISQGKRNDLVQAIENEVQNLVLNPSKAHELGKVSTSAELQQKLDGRDKREILGEKYGLKRDSVARYIRLNSLIDSIKVVLDTGELSLGAGCDILL